LAWLALLVLRRLRGGMAGLYRNFGKTGHPRQTVPYRVFPNHKCQGLA
jgi:hypothetical protein